VHTLLTPEVLRASALVALVKVFNLAVVACIAGGVVLAWIGETRVICNNKMMQVKFDKAEFNF